MPTLSADEHGHALEAERLLDRAGELAGEHLGAFDGGVERHQDGELVAADAGHELGLGGAGLQARADLAQEPVAGVVAERVVELLEVVEVDQQQRELGLGGARGGRGLVEAGEQLAAVGETRQRIVQGVVLALGGEGTQLVLEPAAVGRVAHVEHEALDARVVQAVGGDDVEVAVPARAVGEAQGQRAAVLGVAVGVGEVAVERGAVVRVDEVVHAGADDRVGGVAEHAADRLRLPAHAVVGADDGDDVGGVLDDRVQAALDDLRGLQRDEQRLGEHRRERHGGGAGEVGLELLVAAAGVRAEQRGHPQDVAGEWPAGSRRRGCGRGCRAAGGTGHPARRAGS